jgi:hypothetical protein
VRVALREGGQLLGDVVHPPPIIPGSRQPTSSWQREQGHGSMGAAIPFTPCFYGVRILDDNSLIADAKE